MAYSCEYQNENQSALWSRRSVNLFTVATYNAEGKEESFLIVLTLLIKGKTVFVLLCLNLLMKSLLKMKKN